MTSRRQADVLAAGGIVWRLGPYGLEVLLVYRPSYRDWAFPKGKVKVGEDCRAAAIREIAEETGVPVGLRQPAGSVSYVLRDGRRKEVRYWVAVPLPANHPALRCRPPVKPARAREIGASRWFQLKQALALLSMPNDREVLRRAVADGETTTAIASRPVLLVRHAQARKRSAWPDGEETRPLTIRGKKQSRALASQLSWYGADALVSSSWERCMATLRPYAKSARLPSKSTRSLRRRGIWRTRRRSWPL
ncbi:NUDIX domain-containing protein [Actinobaculum sp. 313]|uniref:NUDIX domain-containing protein n=1 Tax=Actinobaculum sp. 313 TaxID=2495645 RepID=UPI000D52A1CA|nr:NUDIX domain-containing protein [Actinobaculum sp. 313]AWE43040.1 NUDIX hydrolase [Actinobaculum sp. 313]